MKSSYGYAVSRNEVVVGTGAKFILYAFFTLLSIQVMKSSFQHLAGSAMLIRVKMVEGTPVTFQTTEEKSLQSNGRAVGSSTNRQNQGGLADHHPIRQGMIYNREEL